MATEQRKPKGGRDEFEIAFYTKELGRSVQRRLLQQRIDGLSEARMTEAAHGEEMTSAANDPPPPDDRAG